LEVRELRRANAIPKSASACLARRSVSARPVDLPVHRDQEGGVWGLADLQGAHWRRSQDRPEFLTHARRSRPPSARSLRDETLKAEISKVHKNQLLGAGARKMHVMRGRPEIAERHGAGHVARCTARAAHGRPGPTRCQTRQVAQNDALGSKGPVPGRPRQKACQRVQAERAVGRRHSPASGRCPPPMYASSPGGSMWLSWPTCTPGGSSAGRPPTGQRAPTWPWTPWRWPSGSGNVKGLISLAWCITCDRGVQYRSIRYGQALFECEAVASVGSKGGLLSASLWPRRSTRCTRPS